MWRRTAPHVSPWNTRPPRRLKGGRGGRGVEGREQHGPFGEERRRAVARTGRRALPLEDGDGRHDDLSHRSTTAATPPRDGWVTRPAPRS